MFPFIPRKVAQAGKSTAATASSSQSRRNTLPTTSTTRDSAAEGGQPVDVKGKRKAVDTDPAVEDYYSLLCLALSDHAIWADSHLRSRLINGSDGYIPLRYLLSHSPVLTGLDPSPSETVVAKVVRAQECAFLDIRVLVSAPSRAAWYGKDSAEDVLGGYEVRRRDWPEALRRIHQLTEDDWAARSVYVENIPFQYRTTAAIARFIHSLTVSPSSSEPSMPTQHIWLPPHVQDKPGDQPKCKGFALISVSTLAQAENLAHDWPWDVRRTDLYNVADTAEAQEAVKFGFRVMPRARWDALREEYLAYRQTLLDALAYSEHETGEAQETNTVEEHAPSHATAPSLLTTDLSSPYPQGCLVFVRNVHPETNKTTLRALFSQPFTESGAADAGVDYVDFSKGMDTCYLRLASARHTQLLTAFFAANSKAQNGGLDTTGVAPSPGTTLKAVTLEVVEGIREELYWNKVPEKVRRQAVEKATATSTASDQPENVGEEAFEPAEKKRKRKRRKRDE
ncbi:uncharacterized protein C8Q71DRAFT_860076 [Rhodofomes roseus]|uniref:XRRM domain-containing protein n=1 Tax=Rhodofomes roseus TaxID=34475 RepID=A0ABQ8K958_9APHY|nr:uncharacterized protein C8Q71DRAFT_860076 [Rhodofomes roseus]KAH9833803.1 hypothetical protein C8Q71DRAFT_860076 [Rhodofomes roseus]